MTPDFLHIVIEHIRNIKLTFIDKAFRIINIPALVSPDIRAKAEVEEAHAHLHLVQVLVLVDVEDVGAAGVQGHGLLYLGLCGLFFVLQLALPRRVEEAVVAADGGLGGEGHVLRLVEGDGEGGVEECLVEAVRAVADALEHLEAVQRIALEGHAVVAGRELELLVDLAEAAEEADLDACLTFHPGGVGQTEFQYAADAGIEDFNFLVDERADVDVDAEVCSQIGVELAHGIPPLVTHGRARIDAEGVVAVVDECRVEAGDGIDAAIEESEVYIDVAPGGGTHHDASLAGVRVEELPGGGCAAAVGLADVRTHVGLVGLVAAEELRDLRGDGWQLAAVGQLVAEAEVGVGADIDFHKCAVVLQELDEAALVLGGLADVEVPLRGLVGLFVFDPRDLELQVDLGLQCRDAALLLLVLLLLVAEFGVVVVWCLAISVLLIVAGEAIESGLRVLHPLVDFLRIQLCLELIHLGLQRLQGFIGLGDLRDEFLGVGSCLHGDVEAKVAVYSLMCIVLLVLVDERAFCFDQSIYGRDGAVEHEGGEAVVL